VYPITKQIWLVEAWFLWRTCVSISTFGFYLTQSLHVVMIDSFVFSLRETTVDLINMNFGNLFIYICYRESCVIFNWDFLANLLRSSRPTYKLIFILQLVLFLGFFFTDIIILVTSSLVGSLSVEIRSPSMLYQCRHKCDLTEHKVQKIRSTQSTFLLTCKQKRVL